MLVGKITTLGFNRDISTSELLASSENTSSMQPCSQGSSKSSWINKYKCLWEQQPKNRESKGWRNIFLSWTSGSRRIIHPYIMKTNCFLQGLLNARYLRGGADKYMPEACIQTYRAFSPFGKIKISLAKLMQSCCPVGGKHTIHLQSSLFTDRARELVFSCVIAKH